MEGLAQTLFVRGRASCAKKAIIHYGVLLTIHENCAFTGPGKRAKEDCRSRTARTGTIREQSAGVSGWEYFLKPTALLLL